MTRSANPLPASLLNASKYRLVTRSDFDGLVCAVLLKHLNLIDDILFVHPKDMQDGKVPVTERDITTNLPYCEGVGVAFDHHSSETLRNKGGHDNHIIDPEAKSAARVVYDYFAGSATFPERWNTMMKEVDKADSADFTDEEILNPSGWVLLNFLMDPRTGLGRFRNFRISNYNLMMDLIDYCKDHDIDEIMTMNDVQERVVLYCEQAELFREQIRRCATKHDQLVVLHLKDEEVVHAGNRFMIYALNPDCNISIHEMWGLKKQNTVFAVGKSIINRTSPVDIGELCLRYGGGGHVNAGTCQVENDQAETVLKELIDQITSEPIKAPLCASGAEAPPGSSWMEE